MRRFALAMLPHLVVGGLAASVLFAIAANRHEPGLAVGTGAVLAIYLVLAARRPWRIRRALARPLDPALRGVLERRVRFYRWLDASGRTRFEANVQRLLAEHAFEGVGVDVTDELRVLAVAGAAILVHGMEDWELPSSRTVLFYPNHFDEDHEVGPGGPIAGMVHRQGPIIFSVPALLAGFRHEDGHNVAIHEFAHVLDLGDGYADGVPEAVRGSRFTPWASLVRTELAKARRGRTALHDYAGTNEAELFAVAAETFFERPRKLRAKNPDLYRALVEYFGLDPDALGEGGRHTG